MTLALNLRVIRLLCPMTICNLFVDPVELAHHLTFMDFTSLQMLTHLLMIEH